MLNNIKFTNSLDPLSIWLNYVQLLDCLLIELAEKISAKKYIEL